MKTLLFGVALFMSVITVVSFISQMLEAAINRKNAYYGYSLIVLAVTTALWTIFYHLS